MSTLTYNNIEIELTKTENVTYTPAFTEGGSYQWTRVDITVTGLINPAATSYAGLPPVATAGVDAGTTIKAIRSVMLQRRGHLLYQVGTERMIESPDPTYGFACDPNNGPIPGPLTITRVDGTKTLHVRFSVTTFIIECPAGTEPTALITNSFSQSHGINAQQMATITTTGQALFREDILEDASSLADTYRELLVQPCPLGFQPTSMDFATTPSRNALTYRYIFTEKMYDLGNTDPRAGTFKGGLTGSGVIDAQIERTVSSTSVNEGMVGFMTLHSVSVRLTGTKAASNWSMTQLGFGILQSMLPIGDPKAGYIAHISVYQQVTGRAIGIKCDMMLNVVQAGKISVIAASDLREDNIFTPQGGLNPMFLNRNGTAGTYDNEMKASAWKSLCQPATQPQEGDIPRSDGPLPTSGGGSQSTKTAPVVTVAVIDVLPDIDLGYSSATASAAYTEYKINTSYPIDQGIKMCPVASSGIGGQGGATGITQNFNAVDGNGGVDDTPDAVFLTLARPTTKVRVDIEAARVSEFPALPALNPDPNMVLLEVIPAFRNPVLMPDGVTWMYLAAATYIYGLRKSLQLGGNFNVGAAPYGNLTTTQNVFSGENFIAGIDDGPPTDPDNTGTPDGGGDPTGQDGGDDGGDGPANPGIAS